MTEYEFAGWLNEGHFYSFLDNDLVRHYFMVLARDWAHIEYHWEEDVAAGAVSGPFTPADLETTKEDQLWQIIFGIKPDAYIYVYMPTDIARHGVAKRTTGTSSLREAGHYKMQDSPFERPSFYTEHFLVKPYTPFISFQAYNPQNISFKEDYNPIKLNFKIAKCVMENIGTEDRNGEMEAAHSRFNETLDKLHRRVIPHRPLTLYPVRAPAKGA